MSQAVIAQIGATGRIVGFEALGAISDRAVAINGRPINWSLLLRNGATHYRTSCKAEGACCGRAAIIIAGAVIPSTVRAAANGDRTTTAANGDRTTTAANGDRTTTAN